ncbi:hypothetical protein ScPMuIL_011012 [Solemya velum]
MEETTTAEFSQPERGRAEGHDNPHATGLDEGKRDTVVNSSKPFSVQIEIDFMQFLLTLTSMATRLWKLGLPRAIVFDELHYARYVSLYMKKTFYYDSQPPLGTMLMALAGGFAGYDGDLEADRIGGDYAPTMPVYTLRFLPAVLGSLIIPLSYQIAVELGMSRWAAVMAGLLLILDNSLLVQSRYMLLEGIMIFFLCVAVLSLLKFRKLTDRQFSLQWWFWLCSMGVSSACALSTRFIGFFTALLLLYLVTKDFWKLLIDCSKSELSLVKHLLARLFLLVSVPVALYVALFYLHLRILTKAGPHDNIMTSAFQASLEGGLAALTKGQPLHISYGSQITLRHTFDASLGKPCWLHSHNHVYPLRYPDNRGSSHQQQVTCYIFKDVNNWWIIKDPDMDLMVVDDPPRPVKHGDIVQVVHGMSNRALNSHDVAAAMSPQNQEVSCYINYNISMAAQNLWRVEIINRDSDGDHWQTIRSHVRLIHVNSSSALKMTGKQLPEWGFNQLEVSADRLINQRPTIWNVEEHRYTRSPEKEQLARDIASSEMIPLQPTELSFWVKFLELQYKMLLVNTDVNMEHKFSSEPQEWPFTSKNIAYWMSGTSNAQIHLLGNPVIWYSASLSVLGYLALFVFYMMRRQRQCFDISEGEWNHFIFVGELLIGGYFLHYLPFFLTERTLFLHHYLPCVVFKVLALSALVDHLYIILHRYDYIPCLVSYTMLALVGCALWAFIKLAALSYGSDLTTEELEALTWIESWDFLVHIKLK